MIPAPLWCGCPSFLPHGDHLWQTGTGHETLRMAATVLIVDDHPGFRAAARRLLELEGYVVVGEAADGETAIIGGGGFRVPLVYGALLRSRPFDDVVLHDVDAARLDRIADVLEGQAAEHGERLPFRATTDLDDALEGADFVFVAIRVGGLEGRTVDEAVPLGHGVLGQETTGPGGICFALRTIPAMVDLAERMVRRAPGAWLINFTNPAGMVTEALQQVLGDRAIGICDSPSGLCRRVAAALGSPPEPLAFDYFGLNHLGWLKGVRDSTGDRLPDLLADDAALDALEEAQLFGAEWLRSLGMIPNEYLYYFYFAAETVAALEDKPRGAYLL